MKYKRLTERDERGFPCIKGVSPENLYKGIDDMNEAVSVTWAVKRLAELEDKIERGELISTVRDERGDQELAFFVEHNAEVRKQAIKEIEAAEDEVAKETEEILFIDVYNRLHEKGDYMGCVIVAEMAKERGVLWEEQE